MNGWLILCCLASSSKYVIYIQGERKKSAISNSYTEKWERWNHYDNDFLLPLKKYRLWEGNGVVIL
jgi:hypothetical protein